MSHFFEILNEGDTYDALPSSAIVIKNIGAGPFVVDGEGRQIHSMGIAAVDKSCNICKAGIDKGQLVVLSKKTEQTATKSKSKSVSQSADEEKPTVASAQDADSVQ